MATSPLRRRQAGISMIEVLVGLVIGLIGMVIMLEMLTTWDARKRTTASGNEAQIAGAIAQYSLERDLKLAGFNLGFATMGGTVTAYNSSRPSATSYTFTLTPILITQGSSGAPDQIAVLYGSSDTSFSKMTYTSSTATEKVISQAGGVLQDDLLIAKTDTTAYRLFYATAVSGTKVTHITNSYNAAGGWTPTCSSSCDLYNLGSNPRRNIWLINNGVLTRRDDISYTGTQDNEIATGIIDLQAQYGVDANNDGKIASGEWTDTTTNYAKIRAIRVAILARSQQFEPPVSNDAAHTRASSDGDTLVHVTETAPSWSGGNFTMTNLDGSAANTYPTDPTVGWRNYRYRVFESVIPLRNMIWGTPQ